MLVFKPFLEGDTLKSSVVALGGALVVLVLVNVISKKTKVITDKNGKPIKPRKLHRPKNTLPLLGNLPEIRANSHRIHDFFTDMCNEFQNEPWFDNFPKGEYLIDLVKDLLGNGLISSDGERWYHQRKTAVKFFSAKSLRAFMMQSMKKNMQQMYVYLDQVMADNKSFDLQKLLHQFTLQTFLEMGLGVELDWIGAETSHPVEEAADIAPTVIVRRSRMPRFMWKIKHWLNLGSERELRRDLEIFGD